MAKSRSRKGTPDTPPGGASPVNGPAASPGDDADRTVVLPAADADPTLNLTAAADTPSVADPRPVADARAAAPVQAERKELVGSLRSKEQLRARDRARGREKGKGGEAQSGGIVEWLRSVAAAVLLFFVIRTFLITAYSIPSESMEDTLLVGDYLMANNAIFGATIPFSDIKLPALRDPGRGEIVVFRPTYNSPQIDVVKRVIGTPGDTLQMTDGVLFRNGRRVTEAYAHYDQGFDEPIDMEGFGLMDPSIRREMYGAQNHLPLLLPAVNPRQYRPSRNNWGPLVVPAGHYWLMGDNRDQSLDSRYMGPIPRRVIRGKPLFIYYSYDKRDQGAAFPRFVTAARWGRIGDRIR
ncbi:MAG TPA: signal peptidase I [Longimicrobium sp.]